MAVSVLSTVINDYGDETKLFRIKQEDFLLCANTRGYVDYDSFKITKSTPTKVLTVRFKNYADADFKLVCDVHTMILCKKQGETQLIRIEDLDLTCLVQDISGRYCKLLKKLEFTNHENKEQFATIIPDNADGFYCSGLLVKTI